MDPLSAFPDPILALRELLDSLDPDELVAASTAVPSGFTGTPAMYRIRGIGGSDNFFTDSPTIDVDALAGDEQAANHYAEIARQLFIRSPHSTSVGVIDRVVTLTRPHQVPYGANPKIFNATAAYRLILRRPLSAG